MQDSGSAHGLTREQLVQFDRDGFLGPLTLWEPDEMRAFWKEQRKALLDPVQGGRSIYPGNPMNYDRHLDIPGLARLIGQPQIIRKLQSLIGPDLLCWRTEFFPKKPGDSGTGWHQVETYAIAAEGLPMLRPTKRLENVPTELTVWIACTEATEENGCLKFMPGSHKTWYFDESRRMTHITERESPAAVDPSKHTFFGYNYDDLKIDPSWVPDESRARHMVMQPGQFVIFTARCMHGSLPNTSQRKQRMGFAVRVVPTHVQVYAGMTEFNEFGHYFNLERFGCVLVAGEDRFGHNRIRTATEWGDPMPALSAA
jgi:chlorinating enzyme